MGLFAKKLDLQEGEFGKKKMAVFTVANIAAHLLAWVVVAPVLDILIYAEPVKKVFAQGAFAAVSNIITAVVVGGCWCWPTLGPSPRRALSTRSDPGRSDSGWNP